MIFLCGIVFGIGLVVSGLTEQEIVLDFLRLDDLGLGLTMAAALAITIPVYRMNAARGAPMPKVVEPRHVAGGLIFGVGWGISGVCPGAAIASLGTGNWPMLGGLAGMLAGAYLHGALATRRDWS